MPYLPASRRAMSGNAPRRPRGPMRAWRCACGATGLADTFEARRRDFELHRQLAHPTPAEETSHAQ